MDVDVVAPSTAQAWREYLNRLLTESTAALQILDAGVLGQFLEESTYASRGAAGLGERGISENLAKTWGMLAQSRRQLRGEIPRLQHGLVWPAVVAASSATDTRNLLLEMLATAERLHAQLTADAEGDTGEELPSDAESVSDARIIHSLDPHAQGAAGLISFIMQVSSFLTVSIPALPESSVLDTRYTEIHQRLGKVVQIAEELVAVKMRVFSPERHGSVEQELLGGLPPAWKALQDALGAGAANDVTNASSEVRRELVRLANRARNAARDVCRNVPTWTRRVNEATSALECQQIAGGVAEIRGQVRIAKELYDETCSLLAAIGGGEDAATAEHIGDFPSLDQIDALAVLVALRQPSTN